MQSVKQLLQMTKDALQNEAAELDRSNYRYEDIQTEIREIDSLILRMERIEARRRSAYEKRIRTIKRMREREIRRRIYQGLRMDPVGSDRSNHMVNFRGDFVKKSKRKAGY